MTPDLLIYQRVLNHLQDLCEHKVKKIKINDRMPARNKKNIDAMMKIIFDWRSKHKNKALKFAEDITPLALFEILHGIRRWYSGQTMARLLRSYHNELCEVMDLDPEDAIGIFRGFKVPRDHKYAKLKEGDEFTLPVTRNRGFSSWSTTKDATNRFSGKTKDKIGLIIQLIDTDNVMPILAPPERTSLWFNKLYSKVIGDSYRQTEGEYLIFGSGLRVKVVKVKR